MSALELRGVSVRRGDLAVCRDVWLSVPAGEITVLLGANGAGKTTLLDGIAGMLPLASGEVLIGGRRIDRLPVHRRVGRGLAYVEQGRTVFSRLTVAQNLAVVDRSPAALTRAFALFPQLAEQRDQPAGLLSGGEQQMLMVARALATRPDFLLVDELSLGLAPRIVATLAEVLARLAREGTGILLVEQFVDTALRIGADSHIMRHGRIVLSASCAALAADRASLVSPYLLPPE
ncbi:ABC transporter ATP-binding protein [Microbacterium sp. A93]|uniref:ABC transporter ATP-binding protein n=1 Tax=Microbacterium sp. A93 TaxID=3450716 RepID=UPI003F41CADC